MRVSVIIPAYNNEDTIKRAITSALEQTVNSKEVIVIDDASTDATKKQINKFESDIKIHNHDQNLGGGAARNTGIRHAKGEYIAFLDADDKWLPTKLEKQLDDLDSREGNWVASYCGHQTKASNKNFLHKFLVNKFGNKGGGSKLEGGKELIPKILTTEFNTGGSSTLMIKRRTLEMLEGFDEDFPRHQDLELLIRLLKQGKLAYLDKQLVIRYNTGVPSPEKVKLSKKLLFKKFKNEIKNLEDQKIDIYGIHHGKLTQRYYYHGHLIKGSKHLLKASFSNSTDLLRVVRSLFVGIKNSIRRYVRRI